MPRPRQGLEPYIPDIGFSRSFRDAYLEKFWYEMVRGRKDLVIQYQELVYNLPPEVDLTVDGPQEHVEGEYHPRQVCFHGIDHARIEGCFSALEQLPDEHLVRSIRGLLAWYPDGGESPLFILAHGSPEYARLEFVAANWEVQPREGNVRLYDGVRKWACPPPMPAGPVSGLPEVREKYSGDPVHIVLGGSRLERALFVGGLEEQSGRRPDVQVVLNLSEEPSMWVKSVESLPSDRWERKGEGYVGMQVDDLRREGAWVVSHLSAGRTVLVHCSAGMNRSVSVCCAALILLEKISAEAALERVREYHPWARPDSLHWLHLRALAKQEKGQ